MPIPDSYKSILDTLQSQTANGCAKWREGDNKYVFLVSFDRFSIKLADSGMDDRVEYTLSVLNEEGQVIDAFTLSRLDFDFESIRTLWDQARRNALGLEDALREIEQQLRGL